jgi:hypothetical protein
MKKIMKTKKLKNAIDFLCDESISDTSQEAWFEALKTQKIKAETIYKAMAAFGMKWDVMQGCWYTKARRTPFVRTMISAVKKIDFRL